tara:strand:+ start:575 stop:946 length:372 start_codon:yes stop_codon:yes gene_type:complete
MSSGSQRSNRWIPEIMYEESEDGLTSNIPFIQVPTGEIMPGVLFIFESRDTGEFEPGPDGEELPVTDLELHQFCNMNTLKANLSVEEYDRVRAVLGLEPLKVASQKGTQITQKIREGIKNHGI